MPPRKGGRVAAGARKTGIEQYGQDAADDYLKLDEELSDGAGEEQGWEEDEDVMALKPYEEDEDDDAEGKKKKTKTKKGKDKEKVEDEEEEEDLGPASKGWNKFDFYGGDDAGDDSDGASDEDFTFQEARKIEELRAARLKGSEDPLAALLGPGSGGDAKKTEKKEAAVEDKADGGKMDLDANAQFEQLFAAEAQQSSVKRDLNELSDAKRKSLLKKESPELMPLLEDFKAKLASLRFMLPLLNPRALARLSPSGAEYLRAKASLVLNHLANLSFYLMLKAEGGDVKAHPVISQLVWLKDLDGQFDPLDKRLSVKLKKATKAAEKLVELPEEEVDEKEEEEEEDILRLPQESKVERSKKLPSLEERLAKVRGVAKAKSESGKLPKAASKAPVLSSTSLLQLPGRRRKLGQGSGEAPADLDELDPVLGAWLPSSSVNQQLSEVQQHLRERKVKSKPEAPDVNPEPRQRVHRERVREEIDPRLDAEEARGFTPVEDIGDDDDGGELIRQVKAKTKARKEEKEKALTAKEALKLQKQFKPEQVLEGRRGTTKKILENRGLARQRKKKAGNARVSNRDKYEKMVKRRKGAVQEMREGAADGASYEGEATGLRTHVKKSKKIG